MWLSLRQRRHIWGSGQSDAMCPYILKKFSFSRIPIFPTAWMVKQMRSHGICERIVTEKEIPFGQLLKTFILTCSLDTTGNWILMSQPLLSQEGTPEKSLFTQNFFSTFSFYLIVHRKYGAICDIPLNYKNKAPQHGEYFTSCVWKDTFDQSDLINPLLEDQRTLDLFKRSEQPVSILFLTSNRSNSRID